jgi:hypothetical protein
MLILRIDTSLWARLSITFRLTFTRLHVYREPAVQWISLSNHWGYPPRKSQTLLLRIKFGIGFLVFFCFLVFGICQIGTSTTLVHEICATLNRTILVQIAQIKWLQIKWRIFLVRTFISQSSFYESNFWHVSWCTRLLSSIKLNKQY